MAKWQGPPEPVFPALSWAQKARAGGRYAVMLLATVVGFPVYWLGLALERLAPRLGLSTLVIWLWCSLGVRMAGLRLEVVGTPMTMGGARVANHASWLDIFTMRSAAQIFFVAKEEVASWPLIGFIARNTGTTFVARRRSEAKRQEAAFLERFRRGDRLLFFPEGTSSDGLRVLPFKSSLFAAFVSEEARATAWVQPMTTIYLPPAGFPDSFYGWWGDMGFGEHIMQVFGRSRGGVVRVVFHDPVRAADFADRKALAAHCEAAVRGPMDAAMAEKNVVPPPSR